MEWIKVTLETKYPFEDGQRNLFLIADEYGSINFGCTAFDFYDAAYWCPIPTKFPMADPVITNDSWVELAAKSGLLKE